MHLLALFAMMVWYNRPKSSAKKYQWKRKPKVALSRAPITRGVPGQQRWELKSSQTSLFKTVRTITFTSFTTSVGGEVDTGYQFTLANLPGYSEFTSLFDSYRITKVEFTLWPTSNACNNSQYATPSWYIVTVDFDNANVATVAALREVDTAEVCSCHQKKVITFEPRSAGVLAQGAALTGMSENAPNQWINCATTGVTHYGIKMAALTANANGTFTMDITARVFVEFKKTI